MSQLKIAVVGGGVSGLSAAWLLSQRHDVLLYEAESYAGGHANTIDVPLDVDHCAIDTGFIVYNPPNYPNFCALLDHLSVANNETEMTFAVSARAGRYEYAGSGLKGFFGQPKNVLSVRHWRMLNDIFRFFRTAEQRVKVYSETVTLGAFLNCEGYSKSFVQDHILPMGAAIWSTPVNALLDFPARSFISFYANHNLLQYADRPLWRTVSGGSRTYVDALRADSNMSMRLSSPVHSIERGANGVIVRTKDHPEERFDHVVIAAHADQALAILLDPSPEERAYLSQFSYQPNRAVLHTDPSAMPRRRRVWCSWNYVQAHEDPNAPLCVTYWMNRLQSLEIKQDVFVTLNPVMDINSNHIIASFEYAHPVFDNAALKTQSQLWELQGRRKTWFCGSYFGHGFHEDGLQAGLAVAEQLGDVRRPWQVENQSGRIRVGVPNKT